MAQVRGAWVREKHPKRKRVVSADPAAPLRGALAYLSCQPNVIIAATPAFKHEKQQKQLRIMDTPNRKSRHHSQQRIEVEEYSDDGGYGRDERDGYDGRDRRRDEYDGRDHRREEYERRDYRRDEFERGHGHHYTRDASPPRSKPRAASSPYRPRLASHQYTSANAQRVLSSRWSNATTPLAI